MKNKNILVYIGITIAIVIVLAIVLKVAITGHLTDNNVATANSNSQIVANQNIQIEKQTIDNTDYSSYTGKVDLNSLSVTGNGINISGTTITITTEGTYYFTGTANDTNIVVNANDDAKVVLVFDNANITCSNTAVINGINAKKITINLVEGSTNTFTDSSNYTVFTEDDEPNGTVFSKTDLLISGKGTLTVNANYNDGIVSKDELEITDSTIKVTATDDGIRGTDSVNITNANIIVNAKSDGIKSNGMIQINSGTFNITAAEGVEATYVKINDGTINISASDDGINASNKSEEYSVLVEINGGNITITMGQGDTDGVDSNGDIIINGGTISVTGQSTFDYDKTATINGGTVICNGEKVTTLPNQFMGGMQGGFGGVPGGMQPDQTGQRR